MDITNKLWSYCHILRQDGVDNADYIEQLTYLLFLKMADEAGIAVPPNCQWEVLLTKTGEELKNHYEFILKELKNAKGILGDIFQEPISKIKNPVSLKKIIDGIEKIGWTQLNRDVQGEAFEGLLEKIANEGKKGAGQFFTPRPLIQAIVNVMQPNPLESSDFKIADTSCGTAGFLTCAIEWAKDKLPNEKWKVVRNNAYHGQELVVRPYRLALMNLFLHDVIAHINLGDSIYAENKGKGTINCILTNPPFGTRGVAGPPKNRNFLIETSNIQINFVQHIYETLKPGGRAAIVLPDSALSDNKAKELWKNLIGNFKCNVHTILKLPKGTFTPYANGVKACVVFFEKGFKTTETWLYDARTNVEDVTKSTRPLSYQKHFEGFVKSYGSDPNCKKTQRKETSEFKRIPISIIEERGFDLSFNEIHYPSKLESPVIYVDQLIQNFQNQLLDLQKLKQMLENNS